MTESAEPAQGGVPDDEPEISLGARWILWAIAWAIALLLTLLVVFPAPMGVVLLPFFPQGLYAFLPKRQAWVAGWATYLILTIFLLRSRTRTRYFALFVVLCALLAVNIGGCTHVANNTRLPHAI